MEYFKKKINYNKAAITTGNLNAIENSIKYLSVPSKCYVMGVPKNKKINIDAWNLMHDQVIQGSLGVVHCLIEIYQSL